MVAPRLRLGLLVVVCCFGWFDFVVRFGFLFIWFCLFLLDLRSSVLSLYMIIARRMFAVLCQTHATTTTTTKTSTTIAKLSLGDCLIGWVRVCGLRGKKQSLTNTIIQ
jgi:hypothetical protein